jgi:gliding motility-associated-like protein
MKIFRLFLLFFAVKSSAQTGFWSNAGAQVSIIDKAYLSVIGDMYNTNNGTYYNTDSIFLTRNWNNSAGNIAFINHLDSGYVFLHGADQNIEGLDETFFHNLSLKNQGIKYGKIDAKVDGILFLNDRELDMDTQTIWVRNTDVGAVERTQGFVSSLENGGLLRYTNEASVYKFPVGASRLIARYRPIELTPQSSAPNQYKVRFANTDATSEGFDRETRFRLVCEINPNWYHRIFHPQGSDSVDIAIFYDPVADNEWDDIAHWQNVPEWQATFHETKIIQGGFTKITKENWGDFSYPAFALAITSEPFALAGVDSIIWKYDTIQFNGSGGVSYTWSPVDELSCSECPDPLAHPTTSTLYQLIVRDDKGCWDYDSLKIMVRDKPFALFFIPNVITPNGDGINDNWFIRDLERYPDNAVKILNRWGDEVFAQQPYGQQWNGTWRNQPLPAGTYYYLINVKNSSGEEANFDGPLTIIK